MYALETKFQKIIFSLLGAIFLSGLKNIKEADLSKLITR